jgi:hypothetical protein
MVLCVLLYWAIMCVQIVVDSIASLARKEGLHTGEKEKYLLQQVQVVCQSTFLFLLIMCIECIYGFLHVGKMCVRVVVVGSDIEANR